MTKNEYRRSLILLRSNESGYSGHVRMERRVTTGSMTFMLQTPPAGDELRAALIGRDKRGYYACAIGDIRRDARGQGTLAFTFDPRNICGRELDMYRLIAVVRTGADGCALVLLGNLNGYADMDLQLALNAACELYGMGDAVSPAPEIRDAPLPVEEAPQVDVPKEDAQMETSDMRKDAVENGEQMADEPAQISALEVIGLNADASWPAALENVKTYFQEQSPAEDVPDDEFIYVRVPVDGLDAHLLIGVRAQAGEITQIAYALPADYSEDAPEGLSDYHWQGDDRTGWWVLRFEVESGV